MASREQTYKDLLMALGIYDPAFDEEIEMLAGLDRRWRMVRKAWRATAPRGTQPSFLDPHYQLLVQLEDKILQHRTALGLTPAAMRKLKGQAAFETVRVGELAEDPAPENVTVLDLVREKYAL